MKSGATGVSSPTEHNVLLNKRAELIDELQSSSKKLKTVEEYVKTLAAKTIIRELQDKIQVKRRSVANLESKKTDLEKQFKELEAQVSQKKNKNSKILSIVSQEPFKFKGQQKEKKTAFFFTQIGNNRIRVSVERL